MAAKDSLTSICRAPRRFKSAIQQTQVCATIVAQISICCTAEFILRDAGAEQAGSPSYDIRVKTGPRLLPQED